METASDTCILVQERGHVTEITLNRPAQRNAIDEEMHHRLIAALSGVTAGSETRSIVLASTGKYFSAGGDLEEVYRMREDPSLRRRFAEQGRRLMTVFFDMAVPVVAGLHGDAHGLGATLVLACDAVVAHAAARLSDSHVVAGMVAGDGGCVVWPQTAGLMWAKRHLLTGKPLSARDAFARGMVTDLVDTPEAVLPAARALADEIAALPPLAVQGTKRALNRVMQQRAGEVLEFGLALEELTLASSDIIEAVDAFKHERKPIYRGR